MIIEYRITESEGRFYVQSTDDNGETWDADPAGFDTEDEAYEFKAECESQYHDHT